MNLVGVSTDGLWRAFTPAISPKRSARWRYTAHPRFRRGGGIFDFRELVEGIDHEQVVDALGNVLSTLIDVRFSLRKPVEHTIGIAAQLAENSGTTRSFSVLLGWVTEKLRSAG